MEVKVNNKKITDTKIPKDWDRDTIVAHCAKLANINNDDLVKSVFVSRKFVNFITRK